MDAALQKLSDHAGYYEEPGINDQGQVVWHAGPGGTETITYHAPKAGTYYVVITGAGQADYDAQHPYILSGTWPPLGGSTDPHLTWPRRGDPLWASCITFEWTSLSGATQYHLVIGTKAADVEAAYDQILQRVQQHNRPQVEAGRATSSEALKRRMRARRKKDVTHVDSGR